MSEEIFVRNCSPTIMGLKTANMFSCRFESRAEECHTLRTMNRQLSAKGLRVIPLRRHKGATLVYLYRPSRLRRDLKDQTARQLLTDRGYHCENVNRCIARLIRRLQEEEGFPHEIGLFLGYPPEDVSGFIENKAEGCKCVGCWKVYGDEEKAKRTFNKYKECTRLCCSLAAKGCSMEQMAACF